MNRSNIKIAVTGGIGSGKSAVTGILKNENFPVLSCDEIYSELLCDGGFLNKLKKEFGGGIVNGGRLDRAKLSAAVFGNPQKLARLNEITHPAIMTELFARTESFGLCFCEVPLLFENAYEKNFDGVIVVIRDKEERIKSVIERDGLSRENVVKRINSQFDYDNSGFAEYYVIHNNSDFDGLKQSVREIIKKIKENYKIS